MTEDSREGRSRAYEIKFIIHASLGERIRSWVRARLEVDPHGTGPHADEYRSQTLYWDTATHDVFHRRGSYGRAKYRIRRYPETETVFLERKLRRPRALIKRRTRVLLADVDRLNRPHGPDGWPGAWFQRRLEARSLRPACQLSYCRMARGLVTDLGPARLTLDHSMRATEVATAQLADNEGIAILDGRMILELKFRAHLPVIFKQLVEEFGLSPEAASKYRLGLSALAGLSLTDPDAAFGRDEQRARPQQSSPHRITGPLE